MTSFPTPLEKRLAAKISELERRLKAVEHKTDDPVAVGSQLARTSLQSSNYNGSTGWLLNADGSGVITSDVTVTAANGTSVTIGATAPASPKTGDLWFDANNGYRLNQWDGSAWQAYQWGTSSISAGTVTADLIAANAVVAGMIATGALDSQTINSPTINGGVISGSDLVVDAGSGNGIFVYSNAAGAAQTIYSAGSGTWTAPAGVTSVKVECWGAGGGGAMGYQNGATNFAGDGGGGGEYAAEASVAVTPGNTYNYTVGAAGAGATTNGAGGNGGNTTFTGDAVTVTAHGGQGGSIGATAGAGGTGSANTTHYDGGYGGAGGSNSSGGGNEGGGGGGGGALSNGQYFFGGDGYAGGLRLTYSSSAPALVASIASAAGTDAYGNGYDEGVCVYPGGGYPVAAADSKLVQMGGTTAPFEVAIHGDYRPSYWDVTGNTSANVSLGSGLTSSSDTSAQLGLFSASQNASGRPRITAYADFTVSNGFGEMLGAYVTSSETRTSNATPSASAYLTASVDASAVYTVNCLLICEGPVGANFRWSWSAPTSAYINYGTVYYNTSQVLVQEFRVTGDTPVAYTAGTGTRTCVIIQGVLDVASTAGNFTLLWSQGTSNATACTLMTPSYLKLQRIA